MPHAQPQNAPAPSDTLQRNIRAMSVRSRLAIKAIWDSTPDDRVAFDTAADGLITATLDRAGQPALRLASAKRPAAEANDFANAVDLSSAAVFVVMGMGLGYHVAALAKRLPPSAMLLVYEPDVALLRAALERIDHSAWLTKAVILTDDDPAPIADAIHGIEGLLGMGTRILDHAPSAPRLGDRAGSFGKALSDVMRTVRTTVVTSLMQVDKTVGNMLLNIQHYAQGPGIADLASRAVDSSGTRPAIVVAAGPSLQRNIHLLAQPAVQQRFVIIAVQTVLRTLLDHGIRPHFVTALDHHHISARFYEGLTREQLQHTQLVVEPKCSHAILDAFPGLVRCAEERVLDQLLGRTMAFDHGRIRAGATVSHLAYYLARHMGCDPVILVGQDLGFTDHQYYAAHAAIHNVWACELTDHTTLETLEWQRVVRSRRLLRKLTDHLGRPIYTEEQLHTYLVQFERDFVVDRKRGLRVIDATEGGVSKAHTLAMPLAQALDQHMPSTPFDLPAPRPPARTPSTDDIASRLRQVRQDAWRVERNSAQADELLQRVREAIDRGTNADKEIRSIRQLGVETASLSPAYELIHFINQIGSLKRAKADLGLELAANGPADELRRAQVHRDRTNVQLLEHQARRFGDMLDDAIAAIERRAPKRVRERAPLHETATASDPAKRTHNVTVDPQHRAGSKLAALVLTDDRVSGLGRPRDLAATVAQGKNALHMTLDRLAASATIRRVILLATDPGRALELAGSHPDLEISAQAVDPLQVRARARAIGASRALAASSWRGGPGQLCVFDEVCSGPDISRVMHEHQLDGAVLLGGDWCLIDPALVDLTVHHFLLADPDERRAFCPAPPGLGPCILGRRVASQLASLAPTRGVWGTLGSTFAYIPVRPCPDPLVNTECATPPAPVRDAGLRCIADTQTMLQAIRATIDDLGRDWPAADAQRTVALLRTHLQSPATRDSSSWPLTHVIARPICPQGRHLQPNALERSLRSLTNAGCIATLTLDHSAGLDPLGHPELLQLIAAAKEAGAASVQLRTRLAGDDIPAHALASLHAACSDAATNPAHAPDVLGATLLATTAQRARDILPLALRDGLVHHRAVGTGDIADIAERWHIEQHRALEALIGAQQRVAGLPLPWIVPHLTKRDAAYDDIEPFYDAWTMRLGSAVLDPLPAPVPGERIAPLPIPNAARWRLGRERVELALDSSLRSSDPGTSTHAAPGPTTPMPRAGARA